MNKHELIGFFIAVYMKLKDLHKKWARKVWKFFFVWHDTKKNLIKVLAYSETAKVIRVFNEMPHIASVAKCF